MGPSGGGRSNRAENDSKTWSASSIQTVVDVGRDVLQKEHGFNYTAATRLLALSGHGIHLSIGLIHKKNESPRIGKILDELIKSRELEDAGKDLTQEGLERILKKIVISLNSETLNALSIPASSPLQEILKSLNIIDLDLRVKPDGEFAIVATRDETNADKGAMVLVRKKQELMEGGDPSALLASPEGQRKVDEMVAVFQTSLMEKLLALPGIQDADEFKTALLYLSTYMRKGSGNDTLVKYATMNFFERPKASRRVIAEVMKHHGLDHELMDNIETLCSEDSSSALKVEAINSLIESMDELENPTETKLAVESLLKILDEEKEKDVMGHTLTRIAENVEKITWRFPDILKDGHVLPTLKKMLITDARAYRHSIEDMFVAFGSLNDGTEFGRDGDDIVVEATPVPAGQQAAGTALQIVTISSRELQAIPRPAINPVIRFIQKDIKTVTNPFIKLAYYNVLARLERDPEASKKIFEDKWRLYFETETHQPEIAEEIISQLLKGKDSSIRALREIAETFNKKEQVSIIGIMDKVFGAILLRKIIEEEDLSALREILLHFWVIVVGEGPREPRLAVARTGAILSLSPALEEVDRTAFWPVIEEFFFELMDDKGFIDKFTKCGPNYFAAYADLLTKETLLETKIELLSIAYKKAAAIDPKLAPDPVQQEALQAALEKVITETVTVIRTAPTRMERDDLFAAIASLARMPMTTSKTIIKMFGELTKLGGNLKVHQLMAQRTIFSLASHEGLRGDDLSLFIDGGINAIDQNRPPLPLANPAYAVTNFKAKEAERKKMELIEACIGGLVDMFENPQMTELQQRQIVKFFSDTVLARKPKPLPIKNAPPPPEDPFRATLIDALENIKASKNTIPDLKRSIAAVLE